MSFKYIRDYYQVPAKRGGFVKFCGDLCRIRSARGAYLRVTRLKDDRKLILHPTWNVEYVGSEVKE